MSLGYEQIITYPSDTGLSKTYASGSSLCAIICVYLILYQTCT
uniref:Uncharacterized protein n=1 Tax=Rhizophora mucronata TaxID=61149 RepID=A0A2P2N434_RHIMU